VVLIVETTVPSGLLVVIPVWSVVPSVTAIGIGPAGMFEPTRNQS
jgi:hypothetical protein